MHAAQAPLEEKLRPRQEVSVSAAKSRPFYRNHEALRAGSAQGMEEGTREGRREAALHTLPGKWQTPQASRKPLGQPARVRQRALTPPAAHTDPRVPGPAPRHLSPETAAAAQLGASGR